jgi:AcrR family transcriptional regulator
MGDMMGRRVSKDPAVRRHEIVVAAYELFRERGFERVAVNDIVKKVGLAQGTFYYHFKTKTEVLDAVVEYDIQKSVAAIGHILDNSKLDPLAKMQAVVDFSLNPDDVEKSFIGQIRSDANALTVQKYIFRMSELLVPRLARVVEDGNRAGQFKVRYPFETMELFFDMHLNLQHALAITPDPESCQRKLRAAEDIYVKVLGVKPGSLRPIS